jgi:CHAT domain-containing protein/tetratricopeptide (TPR) repeat protein
VSASRPSLLGRGTTDEAGRILDLAEDALRRDPDRCSALLDGVGSLVDHRGDPQLSARAAQLRGELHMAGARFEAAVAAFQAARHHWLAAGRGLEARYAALGRTGVQLQLGEYDDVAHTVERLQGGIGGFSDADDRAVTRLHIMAHRQLGDARAGLGDYPLALQHYDTADNLARAVGDGGGAADVGVRRGLAMIDSGLAHRGMEEVIRAREEYLALGWTEDATRCLIWIAVALASAGRAASALEMLDRIRSDLGDNRLDQANHALARGWALLGAGLADEAHQAADEAGVAFARLGMVERSARAALLRARACIRARRLEGARAELDAAERLFVECDARSMRDEIGLTKAGLALTKGDLPTVRRICRDLVGPVRDHRRLPHIEVRARLVLARATEDLAATADLLQEAATLVARLGAHELRLDLALARSRLHRRTGDLASAADDLRRALDLGRSRGELASPDYGGFSRTVMAEVTEELVRVLLDQGDHAATIQAWQQVSAAKASVLLPLADRTRGWNPDGDGGCERGRIETLLQEVRHVDTAPSLDDRGPELPAVPEGPLIEYYMLEDDIVAFVIREGQVHVRRLSSAAEESRRQVAGWHQECVLIAATRDQIATTTSPALDALYELLIAPVSDLLSDLEDEPLVVVAHRHLHRIPFDALMDVAGPWRNRVALVATEVAEPESPTAVPTPATALVLAVPDSHAPSIDAEASMIAATLPDAVVRVGAEATSQLLADRGGRAGLVHLACHGVFRSGNPMFSALRLGDGWLRARDLLDGRFDLRGSVVVLSACASGQSSDHGPMGLAWACLAAGAEGVVAALWAVDDEVTLALMTAFYRRLSAGDTPRAALGHARRTVARTRPHPYFWSPFRYFNHTTARPLHGVGTP